MNSNILPDKNSETSTKTENIRQNTHHLLAQCARDLVKTLRASGHTVTEHNSFRNIEDDYETMTVNFVSKATRQRINDKNSTNI